MTAQTIIIPARAASLSASQIMDTIDHLMAESILDRLGMSLQDLALEYGDVVTPDGDISHQLYYSTVYSDVNLLGYIRVENGIYYSKHQNNYLTAQQAALDLIPAHLVRSTLQDIETERSVAVDYM